MKNLFKLCFLALYFCQAWSIHLGAQSEIILPPDIQYETSFGSSIDANENFLVVGNPRLNFDKTDINQGAVYIYELINQEWILLEKLVPDSSNIKTNSRGFGSDVKISENYLAIADPNQNSIVFFEYNNGSWMHRKTIELPLDISGDQWGVNMDLTDNFLVVGAANANNNIGAVFIYQNTSDGWVYNQTVHPSKDLNVKYFGSKVALNSENDFLVGSRKDNSSDGGAFLYNFENDNWTISRIFQDDSEFEQGLILDMTENYLILYGNDLEKSYLEIYKNENQSWVFEQNIAEGLTGIFDFIPIISRVGGDFVHIRKDKVFVTPNFLSDSVDFYSKIPGELFQYEKTFSPFDSDILLSQGHGSSLASNDKYLFCGALQYTDNFSEGSHGAVYVHTLPVLNNVHNEESSRQISLSPNPAKNYIRILNNEKKRLLSNTIINASGEIMNFSFIDDDLLDISDLIPGVYIFQTKDSEGNLYSTKFIKVE